MNTPKIADYTTRKSYQQNYARDNREAINARKRAWRKARLSGVGLTRSVGAVEAERCQDQAEPRNTALPSK